MQGWLLHPLEPGNFENVTFYERLGDGVKAHSVSGTIRNVDSEEIIVVLTLIDGQTLEPERRFQVVGPPKRAAASITHDEPPQ